MEHRGLTLGSDPGSFRPRGLGTASLRLGERLLVVEVALDPNRPDVEGTRLDRLVPRDLRLVVDGSGRTHTAPERLVRILLTSRFEKLEDVGSTA